jgi:hypothetical protein
MITSITNTDSQPAHPPKEPAVLKPSKNQYLPAIWAFTRHETLQARSTTILDLFLCIVGLFIMQWSYSTYALSSYGGPNVLQSNQYDLSITLIFPFAGFLLGILQPHPDRHFDLWAFLVHRPVPRWTRFAGRVIAGLILYGIALGIPLVLFLVYASSPYGGIFFHWRLLLPSIASFSTGAVYYLAGLLIAERKAMVFGSKMLPLFTAIACSAVTAAVDSFSSAMLLNAAFLLLLLISAHGAHVSHGYVNRSPLAGRAATILVLVIAFSGIMSIPSTVIGNALDQTVQQTISDFLNLQGINSSNPHRSTYYGLHNNGHVEQTMTTYFNKWIKNDSGINQVYQIVHTDIHTGKVVPEEDPKTPVQNSYSTTLRFNGSSRENSSNHSFRHFENVYSSQGSGQRQDGDETEEWFLVFSEKRFYGYSYSERRGRRFIGTLGQDGFSTGNAQPFIDVISWASPVLTNHEAWIIDYKNRSVKKIFTPPPDENIIDESRIYYDSIARKSINYTGPSNVIAFLTLKHLYLFDFDHCVLLAVFPITHDLHHYRLTATPFPTDNRFALRYIEIRDDSEASYRPQYFDIYDFQGNLLEEDTAPDRMIYDPPMNYQEKDAPPEIRELLTIAGIILGVVAAFCSPVGFFIWFLLRLPAMRDGLPWPLSLDDVTQFHGVLIGFFAIMLLCAADGWRLAVRYRTGRKPLWAFLAFLLGPPVLLTMACTYSRPVRVACGACGKPRALDEESCPHCGALWSPPQPTGTEILA